MFKSIERNCCVECNANGIGLVIYSQGQRQYKVISLYLLGIKKNTKPCAGWILERGGPDYFC